MPRILTLHVRPRPQMKLLVRAWIPLWCAAAWLALPPMGEGGRVEAQAAQAKRHLEQRHTAVQRVLGQSPKTDAARARRDAQLDRMLKDLLDYETLSRRSLDNHWDGRSPAERERFVGLLQQLVERSYKRNLENTLDYHVRYAQAEDEADGVMVRTVARSRKNPRAPTVSIDYRLHRVEGQWRVYDVITDGVSMVQNYRSQFNRIIAREGWNGLIDRMKSKLEADEEI
jgi:phospholipid transport system substrate-binding protein